jgi:hypothetical protein
VIRYFSSGTLRESVWSLALAAGHRAKAFFSRRYVWDFPQRRRDTATHRSPALPWRFTQIVEIVILILLVKKAIKTIPR